jgi:hypothetical protein
MISTIYENEGIFTNHRGRYLPDLTLNSPKVNQFSSRDFKAKSKSI